ncbi:MAG: hypothetical protein RJB26_2308 [Pseudomonadota bacterium]
MMTPEGATDLVLALTCAVVAYLRHRQSPGLGVALCSLGLAAIFGVARFSGAEWAAGPHQFLVLVTSTAAVPLLAWCLRWPGSLPSLQPRAACLAMLFGGAGGVIIVGLLGFKLWAALALLLAVALLLTAAWQRKDAAFAAGTLLLLAGGVVQSTHWSPAGLPPVAVLHLLVAAGVALAAGPRSP